MLDHTHATVRSITKTVRIRLRPPKPLSSSRPILAIGRTEPWSTSNPPAVPAAAVAHARPDGYTILLWTFVKISRQIGLRGARDSRGPGLHGLRHRWLSIHFSSGTAAGSKSSFICQCSARILGHAHVTDTWYLTATPQLLRGACGAWSDRNAGGAHERSEPIPRAVINRQNVQELGRLGRAGRMAGDFHYLHRVSIDSAENIYTAEVVSGKRPQKFLRYGPSGCSGTGSDVVGGEAAEHR